MLPMLRVMADGQEHSIQGLLDRLAETFSLSRGTRIAAER